MTRHFHRMPFGAEMRPDGVRFRLWAPDAQSVTLGIEGAGAPKEIALRPDGDGWCQALVADAAPGMRYRYRVNGDLWVPDPASRFQPDDVHGASEVIDPAAYEWTCADWRGRPWEQVVLYELHVGTFSPEGTFQGVTERLDHLVELGITAVELMPVADFPGPRNWGYDGVDLFAPDASYGRPEDLKALIDAAHQRGLMVFLDVVYNHFGPEGNYLHAYAKRFFNADRHTPWGAAINYDGPDSKAVREFFIHNALYWIEEYRIDGLRLDAVHAIEDHSDPDILVELAERVRAHVDADRHVHLVLENDDNHARYLDRAGEVSPRLYNGQWNDDIHHVFHVLATGERHGYYLDYADETVGQLIRCLTEGFAYQGDASLFRSGAVRGEPSADLPPTAFVNFAQNHDQIGNRAFGDRLCAIAPPEAVRAVTAILLLAPSPPLLFMGEEWASSHPFLFFCSFGEELSDAVREGRRKEFAAFPEFRDPAARSRIPDPSDEDTFNTSKLDWTMIGTAPHDGVLNFHKQLLALRKSEIVPRLRGIGGRSGSLVGRTGFAFALEWRMGDGSTLVLVANMASTPSKSPVAPPSGRLVYATDETAVSGRASQLPPWTVAWFVDESGMGRP